MSSSVLAGKVVWLNLETMTCEVQTDNAGALCDLPFAGEVVVMRVGDWEQTTTVLRNATKSIVDLERKLQVERDNVERIGDEFRRMQEANAELQAQLNAQNK